jgi:nucleotide-binding universal stress UspA family protein
MLILVGAHESPGGATALRWAHRLASTTDSSLVAVRAWEYGGLKPIITSGILPPPEEVDAQVKASLDRFVTEALGEGAAKVTTSVGRGPADYALLMELKYRAADLIVVGRRGLGRVEGRLLGSVSRRLIECARCPVVVTPLGVALDVKPVLVVGFDGSPNAEAALEWTVGLAALQSAEVVAVHARPLPGATAPGHEVTQGAGIVDHVDHWLSGRGVRHRVLLRDGDARHVLDEVAAEEQAGLLVVGAKGVGTLAKTLVGSVAAYTAQHAEVPVAVVPPARPPV